MVLALTHGMTVVDRLLERGVEVATRRLRQPFEPHRLLEREH